MRLTPPGLIPLLAAVLLASCATGPTIRYDEDPAANFALYSTYGFSSRLEDESFGYQSFLTRYLETAISGEMEARGYRASAEPDLMINFYVNTREKIRGTTVSAAGGGYFGYRRGYYRCWGGYYGCWDGYETNVRQYTEGTLTIDIVDAKRNQLIWEGIAVGRIRESTLDDLEGAVNRVVPLIFDEFTYRAGG